MPANKEVKLEEFLKKIRSMHNQELLNQLNASVGGEKKFLAKSLAYIAEVKSRRLYFAEGFPTLYEFCLKTLPLSSGSVYRRTQVAGHVQEHPLLLRLIASGEMSLTATSKIVPYLGAGDQDAWIRTFVGMSVSAIEESFAGRTGPAESPDLVTRTKDRLIPLFEMVNIPASQPDSPAAPATEVRSATSETPEHAPAQGPGEMPKKFKREKRYAFRFTGSETLRNKLERAKEVMSHKIPKGKLEELLEAALDELLEKHAPELQSSRTVAKKQNRAHDADSAYVPKQMRREAFAKANYACEHVSLSGRRCRSKNFLEVDHVLARALGGRTLPENLQILCKGHNLDKARQQLGAEFIERKIRERRTSENLDQVSLAQAKSASG